MGIENEFGRKLLQLQLTTAISNVLPRLENLFALIPVFQIIITHSLVLAIHLSARERDA